MRFNKIKNKNEKIKNMRVFLSGCAMFVKTILFFIFYLPNSSAFADEFDLNRWHSVLHLVQNEALEQKISAKTINTVIQESAFVPEIVQRDKNQAEFVLTLGQYLENAVNESRIKNGKKAAKEYRTLLRKTEKKYGIPKNVILAFWGMESDYGKFKSRHKISDSFLTLIYDGRRAIFFEAQLLTLMKIADKNGLDIGNMFGSWAGAMGHFQFIPTTLQQYGADGNFDGKIDIINSVGDAMASAGNYLNKMGWNKNERIVRRVSLPAGFDTGLCDGKTKKSLREWRMIGVIGVPKASKTAGLVCDPAAAGTGAANAAYLAYDNFYRVKKWNSSNYYAVAVALLADKLK
jgi:membrane-bound lytic murein transglycosylase B